MDRNKTCGNCYYSDGGRCRRYPPRAIDMVVEDNGSYLVTGQPLIDSVNQCGEWTIKDPQR